MFLWIVIIVGLGLIAFSITVPQDADVQDFGYEEGLGVLGLVLLIAAGSVLWARKD